MRVCSFSAHSGTLTASGKAWIHVLNIYATSTGSLDIFLKDLYKAGHWACTMFSISKSFQLSLWDSSSMDVKLFILLSRNRNQNKLLFGFSCCNCSRRESGGIAFLLPLCWARFWKKWIRNCSNTSFLMRIFRSIPRLNWVLYYNVRLRSVPVSRKQQEKTNYYMIIVWRLASDKPKTRLMKKIRVSCCACTSTISLHRLTLERLQNHTPKVTMTWNFQWAGHTIETKLLYSVPAQGNGRSHHFTLFSNFKR